MEGKKIGASSGANSALCGGNPGGNYVVGLDRRRRFSTCMLVRDLASLSIEDLSTLFLNDQCAVRRDDGKLKSLSSQHVQDLRNSFSV